MKVLEIKKLNFRYKKEYILKNLSLTVKKGDFLAICGQNGSGKSTLLKLVLNQLKKDSGEINLFEKKIEKFHDYKNIGYVPQVNENYRLSFPITNLEFVRLNLYSDFGFFKFPKHKHTSMAIDALSMMNMSEYKSKAFNQLSGGQQQRVMIARALVNGPELLILDEPTVGVDKESKENFFKLLMHINNDHNITIIMVTHEFDALNNYDIKKVYLKEGRIC
ncbi:MAG: ABC transporter ATP-binding protein [Tissierellia bacterium]|nr:ABC transporter ATP-binding protein [Tissierellia bacterium]